MNVLSLSSNVQRKASRQLLLLTEEGVENRRVNPMPSSQREAEGHWEARLDCLNCRLPLDINYYVNPTD